MASKASLSIRLIEPVIFIPSSPSTFSSSTVPAASQALVRGLLTLTLPKPTKITSIEVFLEGKSHVEWTDMDPRGIPIRAKAVDLAEHRSLFRAHAVFFSAYTGPDGGWKEFNKGIYTYPISISVPHTAPPSATFESGCIEYVLEAFVHRFGTFATKLTTTAPVTLVACPAQNRLESESVLVERDWHAQLQYAISLGGTKFPIGNVIPFKIILRPLDNIAVFRISVFLEEQVNYYTHNRKLVRQDPVLRFLLLSISHSHYLPILPIFSDSLGNSPLLSMLETPDDPNILNERGPWVLSKKLEVPDCSSRIHFTNQHPKSCAHAKHSLKVVLRVQRGDDTVVDEKGRKRQYDISIDLPIRLLSCRCSKDFLHLPTYTSLLDPPDLQSSAPCGCRHTASGSSMLSRVRRASRSSDEQPRFALANDTTTPDAQFHRLLAGLESPAGDLPPAYE